MKRLLVFALLFVGLGCGMNPGRVADPVSVSGKVTFADGKPVRDVILTLQPMDAGNMAGLKIGTDGAFRGDVVPGKYAYYLTAQDGRRGALAAIPEPFRSAHLDRTVEVKAGASDLQIRLN